ncbi:AAA family ATPase [Peribacillus sp. NPDC096622]|uniref:AAA family ATPase n=1 Tax=Peribacillus sp. NPDC096622 TaxID=3364396 RepID=UPI0038101DCA
MNYKISELYIENFKSIEKTLLSFKEKDLTVLDGPNGFGKTSIFDAFELALTGSIRRIVDIKIADGKKGYEDYLFAKDQDIPIIVKLKLIDEKNQEYIIGRKIDHRPLSRSKKKPGEFPSTLHFLSKMEEELTSENESTSLNKLYEIEDFKNTYGLYHYVEQEESTHLFKKSENERMSAISKLFNIEREEAEREKLSKVKNRLSSNKNILLKRIQSMEKSLDLNVVNEKETKVEYVQLLPSKASKKEIWDHKEVKPLDLDQKSLYFNRIDNFEYLLKHLDSFKAAYKNEQINKLIHSQSRIEDVLILFHFQEKVEGLKIEHNIKQKLNRILVMLEGKDVLNTNINWETIYEHFTLPITLENIKDKLTIIKNLNQNSTQLSGMIANLLNTREKLTKQFEKIVNGGGTNSEKCPLCGTEWESYNDLINQITSQTNLYKTHQDQSSKEVALQIEELYNKIFNKLIDDIKHYLSGLISDEIYSILSQYFEKKVDPSKVKGFFDDLNINIEEYVYKDLQNFQDLASRTEQVIEKLREALQETGDFDYEKYTELKDIYDNVFNKDEKIISEVDITNFVLKKEYINYLYFMQSNIQFQKYINLKSKYEIIENVYTSVSNALSIYKVNIESYRAKMIKEIEIPFFIYSGKIIQNYQRGIGIFIREDEGSADNTQIKAIRFVPPQKTDHDIVHTFSSGQLSATVLAFTLALNKVYNNSGLNTILIDDPIQTLDEMNMVSLVELLRNDFGNQQIIVSTHENQISLYIRYKFSKYGYQTKKVNVKEQLYI